MGSNPNNRKQRRATSNASIPLAHPTRSPSNTRTLVDLIAEHQPGLLAGTTPTLTSSNAQPYTDNIEFIPIDPSNIPKGDSECAAESRSKLSLVIDTLLLSFPLSTLHLTLAYLAAHQYAQAIPLKTLLRESAAIAFPMLTLLIHLAHGHIVSFSGRKRNRKRNRDKDTTEKRAVFASQRAQGAAKWLPRAYSVIFPPTLRTICFLPLAIFLGTKLVSTTNNDPFYAVMRRAPAIGTLWVWAVLEMPVGAAALGALVPLIWGVWWMGYGII